MAVHHGARRVAEAVLQIARERDDFDAWRQDLATLASVLGSQDVVYVLDHPDVPFDEKRSLVGRLAGDRVRAQSLDVVAYLIRKRRAYLLPALARDFDAMVNTERHVRVADVTTAEPLDQDLQGELRRSLEARFGGTVTLQTHVDPTIMGGVVVRIGDELMDGSVIGRLTALRDQLMRAIR